MLCIAVDNALKFIIIMEELSFVFQRVVMNEISFPVLMLSLFKLMRKLLTQKRK